SALEFGHSGLSIPGQSSNYYNIYGSNSISFDVSCYYMPPAEMRNNDPFDLSNEMQEVLNLSSNMENMFRNMHEANPNYIWIYAGFDVEGHIFRNYPYDDLSYFIGWNEDGTDYDPWEEDWYNNAKNLVGDQTAFTSPYIDPSVGLVLSIGRPLHYDNGTFIGVVSVDITIEALKTDILNLDVLENGYAFLVDNSGNCISHPSLASDTESEPIINLESATNTAAFQAILTDMEAGNYGNASFNKADGKWYISYVPIDTQGTVSYSLALVVPESDIIRPAVTIQNRITSMAIFQVAVFLVLFLVVMVIIVFVGAYISRKIVEPIKELTNMVKYITHGDLTRELRGNSATMGREVGMLHASFNNLLTSLRFGNTDYYRGDLNRAYQNYRKALELFTTTKNKRGIAIAKNNLGNIYRAWNNFDNAFKYYQEAIDIGLEQDDKKGLASRYNNLALLYLERKNYSTAVDILEKALQLDEEIGNQRGMAARYENLGLVHERKGELDEAERFYRKGIDISKAANDSWSLANGYISLGSLFLEKNHFEEAREYIEQALSIAKVTEDVSLAVLCLEKLSKVYEQLDLRAESHKAKIKAEEIRKRLANPKSVLFVLDYSGSMSGGRIKAARNGALKLFRSQVNPQDEAGVIIFNDRSRVLINLVPVEKNADRIVETIRNLRYPESVTAFYDAIGDALEIFARKPGNEQKWLVALTDGEDNSSVRYTIKEKGKSFIQKLFPSLSFGKKSIPDFIRETMLNINIIIVGVGDGLYAIEQDMKDLCANSPRGRYIALTGRDISQTIEEAFEEVRDEMARVDVEGFTVSDD
ncbi:MAG: tetratricopeptide repeat protein, partial [Candidatus Hodarchaeales archaeon]